MLLFLQFVAITLVSSNNITSKIVSNFQVSRRLERSANNVINYVLKNKDYFINYPKYLYSEGDFFIDLTAITPSGFSAKIISFKCIDFTSLDSSLDCDLTHQNWELIIEVEDTSGQASLRVVQGIRLSRFSQNKTDAHSVESQKLLIQGVWWYQI